LGGELKEKVAQGVAWSMAEKIGSMLLAMAVRLIILRLLTRDILGFMSIPSAVVTVLLVIVDSWVLAESGPPQRAFAERLQVGFPLQHRRFGGALRGAGGPGAPCGALVRHARNRADRPGFLPAAAAQRPCAPFRIRFSSGSSVSRCSRR